MKYGLIGHPLGHSFSPELHSILGNREYELADILPEDLESFFAKREFRGINVTIPYKKDVIRFLDDISDEAGMIGSVNTILNRNGRLFGYNTDAFGLETLISKVSTDGLKNKNVLILGTGGSSLTAEYVAQRQGAISVKKLSRNPAQENEIGADELKDVAGDTDFIINCTPVGMFPDTSGIPYDVNPRMFPRLSGVVDLIYNPLRTRLTFGFSDQGIRTVNGLLMLCAQAYKAHELFTDSTPSVSVNELYSVVNSSKTNIVLIGMPSCGKSSVGKAIAEITGRPYVDCDIEIEKRAGIKIRHIFEKYGEDSFRGIESDVIADICAGANGLIIASGGGAVKLSENVFNLKKNGIVIYIDRSTDKLISTPDRPLSKDKSTIENLYRERRDMYLCAADVTVDGNGTVDETARAIISRLEENGYAI